METRVNNALVFYFQLLYNSIDIKNFIKGGV